MLSNVCAHVFPTDAARQCPLCVPLWLSESWQWMLSPRVAMLVISGEMGGLAIGLTHTAALPIQPNAVSLKERASK